MATRVRRLAWRGTCSVSVRYSGERRPTWTGCLGAGRAAADDGVNQGHRAPVRGCARAHLVDHVAKGEPAARVGEADRAPEPVVAEAPWAGHEPEGEWELEAEGVRGLVAGNAVDPAAVLSGGPGDAPRCEQADTVDLPDHRRLQARQRVCGPPCRWRRGARPPRSPGRS